MFRICFCTFLVPLFSNAESVRSLTVPSSMHFSGRLQVQAGVGLKPAAETNTSRFDLDRMLFNMVPEMPSDRRLFFQMEAGRIVNNDEQVEDNTASVTHEEMKGFSTRIRQAYLQVDEEWKIGLIPDLWLEYHEDALGVVSLGDYQRASEIQYGVYADTDLGVSYVTAVDRIRLGLAVSNGTGYGREETGSGKDSQLFLSYENAGYTIVISYLDGRYDNLPANIAKKNRARIGLRGEWDNLSLYLFQMQIQDNSSIVANSDMFLDAHVQEINEVMNSWGAGGVLRFDFLENQSVYLRHVHWDPEKEFKGNEIERQSAGWILRDEVTWALSWERLEFGKFFNDVNSLDTRETVFLSAVLDF